MNLTRALFALSFLAAGCTTTVVVVPGEGCDHNGETIALGESVLDQCESCTCTESGLECTTLDGCVGCDAEPLDCAAPPECTAEPVCTDGEWNCVVSCPGGCENADPIDCIAPTGCTSEAVCVNGGLQCTDPVCSGCEGQEPPECGVSGNCVYQPACYPEGWFCEVVECFEACQNEPPTCSGEGFDPNCTWIPVCDEGFGDWYCEFQGCECEGEPINCDNLAEPQGGEGGGIGGDQPAPPGDCYYVPSCGPGGWYCEMICEPVDCDALYPDGYDIAVNAIFTVCGCNDGAPCQDECDNVCSGGNDFNPCGNCVDGVINGGDTCYNDALFGPTCQNDPICSGYIQCLVDQQQP